MGKRILNLKLNWSKAKSLQIAIAYSKGSLSSVPSWMKDLEEIEKELEDFTKSATIFMHRRGGQQ
jgi:hypothetical protein